MFILKNILVKSSVTFFKLFKIDINKIDKRATINSYLRTENTSFIESTKHKELWEEQIKYYFPFLPINLVFYGEQRYMHDYFYFYYSFHYLKKLKIYFKKKNNPLFINCVFDSSIYLLNAVNFYYLIRNGVKFSKNIIKEASVKLYEYKSIKEAPKLNKRRNLIYFQFPRHKALLPYLKKDLNNIIGLGYKTSLSKKELTELNLCFIKEIKANKNIKNKKKVKIFLNYISFAFKNLGKPYNLAAIFNIVIQYKSFLTYESLRRNLLECLNPQKLYNFDDFELTRILYLKRKNLRPKIETIDILDFDRNARTIRRSADIKYVKNQKMFSTHKELIEQIKFFKLPIQKNNNDNSKRKNITNKGKYILYLANTNEKIITVKDNMRNFLLTKEVSKELGMKLIFRPHPTMFPKDFYKLYGKGIFDDVIWDSYENIDESVCQANIVSINLSTASLYALKKPSVCFCVGFENYISTFSKLGIDIEKLIGKNLCLDSPYKIAEEINNLFSDKKRLNNYFKNLKIQISKYENIKNAYELKDIIN